MVYETLRCRYCNDTFLKEESSSDYPEEFCSMTCEWLWDDEGSESQEEPYDE